MKKSVPNTLLSTAFMIAMGLGMSACSNDSDGESQEILAKDRVDAAAELAREKAPAAEDMAFAETAPTTSMVEPDAADMPDSTDTAADITTDDAEIPSTEEASADMATTEEDDASTSN